ncbi:MAG: hypothetical protein RPS99_00005 [Gammaproteobacteria bacterium]
MYLQNEAVFKTIAVYIKGDGVLKEISRDGVSKESIQRPGSYVKVNDKFFGAYGSKNGPVIFLEKQEFLLTDEKLKFEHLRGEKQHHFIATYDSEVVCDITYDHWEGIDFDCWSEEESIDFFLWLTQAQTNRDFIIMWTTK